MCSLLVLVTKQATGGLSGANATNTPASTSTTTPVKKRVGWACWEALFLLFSHRLIFINVCTKSSKAPGRIWVCSPPFLLLPCSLSRGSGAYCLHTSVLSSPISFSKMLSFPPVLLRNNWHVSLCKLEVYSVIYIWWGDHPICSINIHHIFPGGASGKVPSCQCRET